MRRVLVTRPCNDRCGSRTSPCVLLADLDLPQSGLLNPWQLRTMAAILNLRIGRESGVVEGFCASRDNASGVKHDRRPAVKDFREIWR